MEFLPLLPSRRLFSRSPRPMIPRHSPLFENEFILNEDPNAARTSGCASIYNYEPTFKNILNSYLYPQMLQQFFPFCCFLRFSGQLPLVLKVSNVDTLNIVA